MQAITKEQMIELDRIMIEDLGIDVPIMMENAALGVAQAAKGLAQGKNILILAGHGNNGGDGLAAARHLYNWGYAVTVALASDVSKLKADSLKQYNILKKLQVKFVDKVDCTEYDLIIDSLLGYNIEGDPKGRFADLINQSNESTKPILAVDIPSGLNATTGEVYQPCIKAAQTVSLSIAKTGLLKESAQPYVGKLSIAYMSVPNQVYEKFNVENPF